MRFNGGGHEGKGVAVLLATGFDHRQHCLDETATGSALRSAQEQTLHLAADRPHSTRQRNPRNPAGMIIGPMLEQFASGRFDLRLDGCGRACGCCVLGGSEEFWGVFRPCSSSSTRPSSFPIRSSNVFTKARTAGVISASSDADPPFSGGWRKSRAPHDVLIWEIRGGSVGVEVADSLVVLDAGRGRLGRMDRQGNRSQFHARCKWEASTHSSKWIARQTGQASRRLLGYTP